MKHRIKTVSLNVVAEDGAVEIPSRGLLEVVDGKMYFLVRERDQSEAATCLVVDDDEEFELPDDWTGLLSTMDNGMTVVLLFARRPSDKGKVAAGMASKETA